jgi:hypothetical protein
VTSRQEPARLTFGGGDQIVSRVTPLKKGLSYTNLSCFVPTRSTLIMFELFVAIHAVPRGQGTGAPIFDCPPLCAKHGSGVTLV